MRTGSVTSESSRSLTVDPTDPLFAEDGPLVGTPAILKSPNVMEPPIGSESNGRISSGRIPTPSVYKDKRGHIYNLHLHEKRVNCVTTQKGTMRSGDLHPHTQCTFVLEGSIELWLPQPDGSTKKTLLQAKDYVEILPYVPHVEHFLQDTVHVEWWEQHHADDDIVAKDNVQKKEENVEFKHWYYAPYRRLVDTSFGWGAEGRGRLTILKEGSTNQDEEEQSSTDRNVGKDRKGVGMPSGSFFAGVAVGGLVVALGIIGSTRLKK